MKKWYTAAVVFFALLLTFSGFNNRACAQLNSVDAYGGMHKFLNSYYPNPAPPMGWSTGLRYNADFSWEWAAIFAAGINNSTFNLSDSRDSAGGFLSSQVKNKYADFTVGLEWQWMTEMRTRLGGGRVSMRGSKNIIMANFKSYLMGGLNYQVLLNSPSSYSSKGVMNWFGGIGFEWYRLGKNAHHGNNAFVPFTEFVYYSNISKPYAIDIREQQILLNAFNIRFGVKYTFGFPEKKFAWK